MSCNYADGLSPYHDKGQLGLEEKFDTKQVVSAKVALLTKWINSAKHVVIHTGAGISTAAGIPDFRGPRGVWTLQAKGEKPDLSKDFHEAIPTITHMAITKLVEKGKVKYVVSQNIDGLHLRSNLPRKFLSELHGNMFTEQCSSCNRQFVRSSPAPSVGQKPLNKVCPTVKANGRPCRGKLHDTILDWEHNLPENDLGMADYHSSLADLSICLGTTMQIVPSGNLPLYTKRHGGTLVIVNLQPTKHDRKADLIIHAYVDEVMTLLMRNLNIKIPKYNIKNDPTRILALSPDKFFEWTITDSMLREMKEMFEAKCGAKEARKRLEMIDDDLPLTLTKHLKRKGKEEEDSDLEVLDVIVKPKRSRDSSKRGSKKNAATVYNTTITIKKVTPPPKKVKYEGEKITIKKNVTPTKTKYEIVTKPKKTPKCQIVYETEGETCTDLDMICESDDDEMTNNFTYNFKRYLYEDVKKEEPSKDSKENVEILTEVKDEIKAEGGVEMKNEVEESTKEETQVESQATEEKIKEDKTGENSTEKVAVTEDKNEDAQKTLNVEQPEQPPKVIESTETIENESENPKSDQIGSIESNSTSETTETMENKMNESVVKNTEEKPAEEGKEKKEETEKENTSEGVSVESGNAKEPESESTPMEVDTVEYQSQNNSQNTTSNDHELEKLLGITETETETQKPNEGECGVGESNGESFPGGGGEGGGGGEEKELNTKAGENEESLGKNKENSNEKTDIYHNLESELSNLSNSNLENQIDQIVNQEVSQTQSFDNALEVPNCTINSSINENYEFYGINSANNSTHMDYTENNYYNNF